VEERGVDAARDGAGLPLRVEPRRPGGLGELLDAALEVDRGAVAPGRGELPLPEAARAARERRRRRRRRNRRRASFFFSWLFFSRKSKDVPQSPLLGKERGRRRRGQRRGLEGEERGEGEGELFFFRSFQLSFFQAVGESSIALELCLAFTFSIFSLLSFSKRLFRREEDTHHGDVGKEDEPENAPRRRESGRC